MKQNPFDPYKPEDRDPTAAENLMLAVVFLAALALFQAIASTLWPTLFR